MFEYLFDFDVVVVEVAVALLVGGVLVVEMWDCFSRVVCLSGVCW